MAIMWTAIGCLIAGLILMTMYFVGQYRANRDEKCRVRYRRVKNYVQVGYFLFFVAAAVLFLIW